MQCPFCQSEMVYHHGYIFTQTLRQAVQMYAYDKCYKCPQCFFVAKFGHPLTKAQYETLFEQWNGAVDWANQPPDEIKQRLIAMGYFPEET